MIYWLMVKPTLLWLKVTEQRKLSAVSLFGKLLRTWEESEDKKQHEEKDFPEKGKAFYKNLYKIELFKENRYERHFV